MKAIPLTTPADLSLASFDEAKRLLEGEGDLAMIVVCARTIDGDVFATKLWDHARGVSVLWAPAEVLASPTAWAVVGQRTAVVSVPPA